MSSFQLQSEVKKTGNAQPYKDWLVKVPEVTAFFWIIKVLATTVGETFADFLNTQLGFGLNGTSIVTLAVLALALFFQFKSKRYKPSLYWAVVVLTSITGTLLTDNLTDNAHVSLLTSSAVFAFILAAVFFTWHKVEASLAVHSIYTPRREAFYWATILFTFALGTATGDLFAERFGFGYGKSLLVFVGLITVIALLWRTRVVNPVLGFWAVYVLTRPLGASIGDLLAQPKKIGGLGLGTTVTSAIFLSVILGLVIFLTKTKKDKVELEAVLGH